MTEAATTTATGLTPKRLYRFLAIAEAITWTLLIIAMIAKYGFQVEWLVPIAGPIHGFVFVSYAAMQLVVGHNQRWSVGTVLLGIVTAVVPYATIPWERRIERRGLLEGAWRTEPTDDPRDARWIDRLYRWGINHALLMAILVLVLVAIVFVVLLNAGPPTEWFD
jgi:integral membrane protein